MFDVSLELRGKEGEVTGGENTLSTLSEVYRYTHVDGQFLALVLNEHYHVHFLL